MKFKIPLFLSLCILVFTTCTTQEVDNGLAVFEGIVVAEFIDSETETPVAGKNFVVSVVLENVDEPVPAGVSQTDENGQLEKIIRDLTPEKVIKVMFSFEVEEESRTVEQEVELELRLEEPFDSVYMQFSI
jgi:hypothetical protein